MAIGPRTGAPSTAINVPTIATVDPIAEATRRNAVVADPITKAHFAIVLINEATADSPLSTSRKNESIFAARLTIRSPILTNSFEISCCNLAKRSPGFERYSFTVLLYVSVALFAASRAFVYLTKLSPVKPRIPRVPRIVPIKAAISSSPFSASTASLCSTPVNPKAAIAASALLTPHFPKS